MEDTIQVLHCGQQLCLCRLHRCHLSLQNCKFLLDTRLASCNFFHFLQRKIQEIHTSMQCILGLRVSSLDRLHTLVELSNFLLPLLVRSLRCILDLLCSHT